MYQSVAMCIKSGEQKGLDPGGGCCTKVASASLHPCCGGWLQSPVRARGRGRWQLPPSPPPPPPAPPPPPPPPPAECMLAVFHCRCVSPLGGFISSVHYFVKTGAVGH